MNDNINSIVEALSVNAERVPDKLALADKKNSVTFAQLWEMVQKGATFLKHQGVAKDDIVVIRGGNKVEFMIAVLSVHLAGGAACPTEKAIKDDRVLEIMEFLGSKAYIADKPADIETINNISLKELFKYVKDENAEKEAFAFPKPEALSEILFTTGTTGKSKGIEVTFACDISIAQNVIDSVDMCEDEVELMTSPINHSLGIRRTYAAIYLGSTAVLTEGFKFANSFYKLLDEYKVTAITFVPAILEQVLADNAEKFATYNKQFHYIQLGSAPLSEANKELLVEMFPDVRLYNTYGATESGCTIILEFSKYGNKHKCIGRKTVNTTVLFVNDQREIVTPTPDNPGYLSFKGTMNMRGYYNEPEITAEVMSDDGIVYTNDLGYLGEDGFVYLLGRVGDVINMGGIKIAPTEIEEVVMKHPMVKDCACIPIPDAITGEAPKLFVALNDGCEFDQVELSRYMLDKLESLKVPKVFEVIDEIPRTFNGKIIRKDLKNRNS